MNREHDGSGKEAAFEFRLGPLGLVVGLMGWGVRVRRVRPREKDWISYRTPLDWVRYCESVRRR